MRRLARRATINRMPRRTVPVLLLAVSLFAFEQPAAWNTPRKPFKIYGNTWYVGTQGLSSVLIASDSGHVLIDGALPESAPLIAASVRSLGFRVEDIRLILSSHVHYDHAGGIAELKKLSGARVAVSPWTAAVMKTGEVSKDDPQFGSIKGIAPVAPVEVLKDGQVVKIGPLALTAHFTPGHTPGGTTWTWQSCENGACRNMVYFDSLSAVSTDGYLYSRRGDHPNGPDDFEHSFQVLEGLPCDVLITPHPEASDLMERVTQNRLVEPNACRTLAAALREKLNQRLAGEKAK